MAAKSRLGQNFLRDHQAIQRIASSLGDLSQRTVIEIGPGQAAITDKLAAEAKQLIAIEFDPQLAAALRTRFLLKDNVTVVRQDVLQFDFTAAAQQAGEKLLIIGNLPYYITSPILLHLASHANAIERASLMVQREVADRVTAQPGSRDYGLLSVTLQLYGPTESLFTLPPSAFSPPPEVHSTVFRWSFAPRFAELGISPTDEPAFISFLKQSFAQKRKTLSNNLRAAAIPPEKITAALTTANIPPQARAETLSLKEFSLLWKALTANSE